MASLRTLKVSPERFQSVKRSAVLLTGVLGFAAAIGLPIIGLPGFFVIPLIGQGLGLLPFGSAALATAAPFVAMPIVMLMASLGIVELAFQLIGRLLSLSRSSVAATREGVLEQIRAAGTTEEQVARLADASYEELARVLHELRLTQRQHGRQAGAKALHHLPGASRIPGFNHFFNLPSLFYSFFFQYFWGGFASEYLGKDRAALSDDERAAWQAAVDRVVTRMENRRETHATAPYGLRGWIQQQTISASNLLWRLSLFRSLVSLWDENVFLHGSFDFLTRRVHLWILSSLGMGLLMSVAPVGLLGASILGPAVAPQFDILG
ncbi:MAG TPA: hypothetical protein VJB16_02460, partial [archaeon]|nr:hypothetical protein [archaeon]